MEKYGRWKPIGNLEPERKYHIKSGGSRGEVYVSEEHFPPEYSGFRINQCLEKKGLVPLTVIVRQFPFLTLMFICWSQLVLGFKLVLVPVFSFC